MQEARLRRLKDTGAKAKNSGDRDAAQTEMAELMRTMGDIPSVPQLVADDVTPEALATLMYDNNGVMAIMSSEGGFVGIASGRYTDKGGPNLDIILKGHAGDPIRVNRASDKEKKRARIIPRPALTMVLMLSLIHI